MSADSILQITSSLSQHTVETMQIVALAIFPILLTIIGFLFKGYVNRIERSFRDHIQKVEESCIEKIRVQDVLIANVTAQLTKERDDTMRDQKAIIDRLARIETKLEQIQEKIK